VQGYSGSGVFTTMMVVGAAAALFHTFGCHICFRVTISVERKKLYYWIWIYMMALNALLLAFVVTIAVALIYWLSADSAFRVCSMSIIGQGDNYNLKSHKRCNDIVSCEFHWIRRTCDYI